MKSSITDKDQKGFTLVELLISSGIFSLVLLLCIMAITQMGRMFYKGINSAKTQEIARLVIEDFSKTVQYGAGDVSNPAGDVLYSGKDFWCIGKIRYSVQLHTKLTAASQYGLAKDEMGDSTCRDDSAAPAGKPLVAGSFDELLQSNMRVSKFQVTPIVDGSVYRLSIKIAFGDDDLFDCTSTIGGATVLCTDANADKTTARCRGQYISSQFCATSELNTVLTRRSKS